LIRRLLRTVPALLVGTSLFVVPYAYSEIRDKHVRNFRVVQDGVLYRSGQHSPDGLHRIIHDYGIRTVVSFRYGEPEGADPPDKWEEAYCKRLGVNHVRVRPREWVENEMGIIPGEAGLKQFLDVMNDPKNHPVLVHCYRGAHRTGTYCAVFRMECHGWSNEEAMQELKDLGYDNLDRERDVREFLEGYVPMGKRSGRP
jgi:tyrosine-protein phosphatase SIW14